MAVNLSPVGGVAAQFFTNTGAVLTGGKLFTYAAGTTTPAVAYTSSNGLTAWTNPIVLDAAGRVSGSGEIWLTDGINYKFVLKDSNDVLIATYDNVSGINSNFISFTNSQQIVTATANQTVFNLSISYQPGTNSLSVFVDGVNQYGPGALYSYVETDSDTVTFNSGLHVGAEVKFTTTQQQGAGAVNASQVTYNPAGAGAVATNVQTKLRESVSVKDFGAVGDGVTNDTVAMAAAAAYISLNGGSLYIPRGTYFITNYFAITGSNVKIYGDGMGASVIKVGAWVDGILISKDGANYPSGITGVLVNITVEDLTIDGNRNGYVNGPNDTYGNGVSFVACDSVVVRNVEVKDVAEQSIVSTYWQFAHFSPSTLLQESIVIDSCVVLNPPTNRIAIGIEGRGHGAKVTNNTVAFSNNGVVGIYIGHVTGSGIDNGYSVVANNIINGSGSSTIGVKIEENMYNITVANNVVSGCAISIRGSSSAQSTFGYTITGNQCINWSYAGIVVDPMKVGDVAISVISSNRILSASPSATSYGIVVASKAHCIGNLIASALTAGVLVNGNNCLITANEIDTPSGYSIDFSASSGSYVCSNKISSDVNLGSASTFFMNIGATIERTSKLNLGTSTFVSNTAAPTTGTWVRGDIVFNSQPSASGFVGFVCVTSGTPGTWKTFGAISA